MAKILIKDAHVDLLEEKRIHTNGQGNFSSGWLKIGDYIGIGIGLSVEPYSGHFSAPYFSSLGSFSYSKSTFPPGCVIGRYCAIGQKATVMPVDHPMSRLSTNGFDYASYAIWTKFEEDNGSSIQRSAHTAKSPLPIIENDVWIGHDVTIKRGIKIGTGSVIAAKSVVTRDVPPYSIVAGNPARIKRFRFSPEIIHRLLSSNWWEYKYTDFSDIGTVDISRFLDMFEKRKVDLERFPESRIDLGKLLSEL